MPKRSNFTTHRFVQLLDEQNRVDVISMIVSERNGSGAEYVEHMIVEYAGSFESTTDDSDDECDIDPDEMDRCSVLTGMIHHIDKKYGFLSPFGNPYFFPVKDNPKLVYVRCDAFMDDAEEIEKILSEKGVFEHEVAGRTFKFELSRYTRQLGLATQDVTQIASLASVRGE
jgi:hypothetical protein